MATKRTRSTAVLAGAVGGAAAFLAGYVVTFVLMREQARQAVEGSVPTWKVVGWYHFNAHFVNLVSSKSFGPWEDTTFVSLIAESSGTTATLLYAVPPLALLVVGVAIAWRLDGADLGSVALGGAATVLGYGLLAVVGALAVEHTGSGSFLGFESSATMSLPMASVVVVAALLYPAVFGTAGATIGGTLR